MQDGFFAVTNGYHHATKDKFSRWSEQTLAKISSSKGDSHFGHLLDYLHESLHP